VQRAAVLPAAFLLAVLVLLAGSSGAHAAKTVTISGKAYSFNHADTPIGGATIRVREMPKRSATTGANGDYRLKVPDDATVTPYIDPPQGFNQIDLQTLHTRGEDIENANFQTPADLEYKGLAAILGVDLGPDGRPTECVVVTTVSARNVRGVPFETFVERTPHGVAGATAFEIPALPGPTYFNDSVIPDPAQTESSGDGGIVWTEVPAGTYRFVAEHPDTRFAPFLATCEPGRVVNANPPWGMYELAEGEEPLGASIVAASVDGARAQRRGGRRRVAKAPIETAEAIRARGVVRARGRRVSPRENLRFGPGARKLRAEVRKGVPRGRALFRIRLKDATGERVIIKRRLRLPGNG
jgi:hypothetical protein